VHDDRHESRSGRNNDGLGWGDLANAGLTVAVAIAIGVVVGWLLDRLLGTLPVFLFLGLLLSVAGAVWYLVLKFRTYLSK
jgi:F0F1-type ATP synthase assembly protein I